nr:basic proline-rich protein-like [Desmodus rotundus]
MHQVPYKRVSVQFLIHSSRQPYEEVTQQDGKLRRVGAAPETRPSLTDSPPRSPFLRQGAVQETGLSPEGGAAAAGPAARGLAGTPTPPHTPTPARVGRAARPALAPAGPRSARPPSLPAGAREAPKSPAPATPAPTPLTPPSCVRGLAQAGESPVSRKRARRPPCLRGPARRPTGARGCGPGLGPPLLTFQLLFFFFLLLPPFSLGWADRSERRWQWTRKLGCRCYCSPLGSGESLSLSSKRAKKAGLPGLHKKRQQPPTAPLQALRGHNTREPLLCPPKRQLSYHLGGRGKGGRGEKCTRSR